MPGSSPARLGPDASRKGIGLIEVIRTNDLVLISKVEAILADAGIEFFLADRHMSAVEGSLSFLPRRVLVASEAAPRARCVLIAAGLAEELRDV
jgi:Putative prokaryotic signal transducing protein